MKIKTEDKQARLIWDSSIGLPSARFMWKEHDWQYLKLNVRYDTLYVVDIHVRDRQLVGECNTSI